MRKLTLIEYVIVLVLSTICAFVVAEDGFHDAWTVVEVLLLVCVAAFSAWCIREDYFKE